MKEYRKRNASGAVYDDPRVAVGAGRFDGVVARAEAESKCKAIRHGVKSLRRPVVHSVPKGSCVPRP